jgi:hypothetical protein
MVKETINYDCEICGSRYNTKKEADKCESQGLPKLYPIGMVFSMGHENMVFAIIKQYPKHYGHHHTYSTHACRDTEAGDNEFGKYCGIDSWSKIYPPNKDIPAYKRMIRILRKHKIKPTNYK